MHISRLYLAPSPPTPAQASTLLKKHLSAVDPRIAKLMGVDVPLHKLDQSISRQSERSRGPEKSISRQSERSGGPEKSISRQSERSGGSENLSEKSTKK